jgi:threonine dehydratase
MGWIREIEAAKTRIAKYVRVTPLEFSPYLSKALGADVWLKLENLQETNSFKVRGAVNAILSLPPKVSRPTKPTTVCSHVNDDTCLDLFV